jgi:hypothetical protein
MTAEENIFATAIDCIDGRAQDPVAAWIRARFGVRYVDTVTQAGADGILARGSAAELELVRSKVMVSTGHTDRELSRSSVTTVAPGIRYRWTSTWTTSGRVSMWLLPGACPWTSSASA